MLIITPKISVKPAYFVTYAAYDSTNNRVYEDHHDHILPTDKAHHGIISYKANNGSGLQ